jgi:hypothetical protein
VRQIKVFNFFAVEIQGYFLCMARVKFESRGAITMNSSLHIPQGEEMIQVTMTVKEALALSGANFPENHKLETAAIKKVKQSIENKILSAKH